MLLAYEISFSIPDQRERDHREIANICTEMSSFEHFYKYLGFCV